jgi:hypothetical protein
LVLAWFMGIKKADAQEGHSRRPLWFDSIEGFDESAMGKQFRRQSQSGRRNCYVNGSTVWGGRQSIGYRRI